MENIENNTVTDIDGNSYNLVQIKTFIWTKENLNVSKYRNGDEIPQVQDNAEWAALTTGAWCYLDNNPDNGAIYGKLYNWHALNDPRGLAPEGFHIPTDQEIKSFISLHARDYVGKQMKEEGKVHWKSFTNSGDNYTGFTALPGDLRCSNGEFNYQRIKSLGYKAEPDAYWWCSYVNMPIKEFNSLNAYHIARDSDLCFRLHGIHRNSGLSVRCIKD